MKKHLLFFLYSAIHSSLSLHAQTVPQNLLSFDIPFTNSAVQNFNAAHPPFVIIYEYNYRLNPVKEISIGAFDIAACAIGYFVEDPQRNISELDLLNKNDLPRIDQWATEKWDPDLDAASAIPVILSGLAAGTVCFIQNPNNFFFVDAVMLGEVYLTQLGINLIVKDAAGRARPYAYNTALEDEIRTDKENSVSFYSGHTSTTAAFSFFAASVFAHYSENITAKRIVWISAATLPAITGLMRIYSGQHFPTDVLVGYAMGAAIGYVIPKLHETRNRLTFFPAIENDHIGMGFSMRF